MNEVQYWGFESADQWNSECSQSRVSISNAMHERFLHRLVELTCASDSRAQLRVALLSWAQLLEHETLAALPFRAAPTRRLVVPPATQLANAQLVEAAAICVRSRFRSVRLVELDTVGGGRVCRSTSRTGRNRRRSGRRRDGRAQGGPGGAPLSRRLVGCLSGAYVNLIALQSRSLQQSRVLARERDRSGSEGSVGARQCCREGPRIRGRERGDGVSERSVAHRSARRNEHLGAHHAAHRAHIRRSGGRATALVVGEEVLAGDYIYEIREQRATVRVARCYWWLQKEVCQLLESRAGCCCCCSRRWLEGRRTSRWTAVRIRWTHHLIEDVHESRGESQGVAHWTELNSWLMDGVLLECGRHYNFTTTAYSTIYTALYVQYNPSYRNNELWVHSPHTSGGVRTNNNNKRRIYLAVRVRATSTALYVQYIMYSIVYCTLYSTVYSSTVSIVLFTGTRTKRRARRGHCCVTSSALNEWAHVSSSLQLVRQTPSSSAS